MDMVAILGETVGLPEDLTIMHASIHEDIMSIDFGRDTTTSVHTTK